VTSFLLAAVREPEAEEAIDLVGTFVGQPDDIERVGVGVDDRRRGDAPLVVERGLDRLYRLAQGFHPHLGIGRRVERVDRIAGRRHDHEVSQARARRDAGRIQRRRLDLVVDPELAHLVERVRRDVRRLQMVSDRFQPVLPSS
jgi:hypothetical protein